MQEAKAEVVWEDPPPGRGRYDWQAIADQLRERPGQWAKIFEQDRASLATAIRIRGVHALLPEKGFEVKTANNKRSTPRLCDLYLRYNPERDESVSE